MVYPKSQPFQDRTIRRYLDVDQDGGVGKREIEAEAGELKPSLQVDRLASLQVTSGK